MVFFCGKRLRAQGNLAAMFSIVSTLTHVASPNVCGPYVYGDNVKALFTGKHLFVTRDILRANCTSFICWYAPF
jgi:hypothetical protein